MSNFRARSSAEILDAAFEIYRRHFAIFFAVGVVSALPMALVQYSSLALSHAAAGQGAATTNPMTAMSLGAIAAVQVAFVIAWAVMLFLAPFADAASAVATARAYRGEPVELADALRAAFGKPVAVLLTYWARYFMIFGIMMAAAIVVAILVAVLKAIGAILAFGVMLGAIVMGIVVWKRYFAVIPVLMIEEVPVADTMSRSRFLADGNGARTVFLVGGTIFLAGTIALILGGIAGALISGVVGAVLYLFCIAVVNQFPAVVLTLLYFDLRIRKEGYDIELLAGSLAPIAAPAPAVATA